MSSKLTSLQANWIINKNVYSKYISTYFQCQNLPNHFLKYTKETVIVIYTDNIAAAFTQVQYIPYRNIMYLKQTVIITS